MQKETLYFDNNEGLGGFEKGAYDKEAQHPSDVNWTRQSRFIVPDQPRLIWKVSKDSAYVDETNVRGSFAVDRHKNAIIADCDNNIVGQHYGRIIQVDINGETEEIFKADMRLKSPVIGSEGLIYLTTTGSMDSTGHKLYCLFPDGSIKWEFLINNTDFSKPVIDNLGNVYMFTYGNKIGTLFSIRDNGTLNWSYKFNSVNWYEPVISKDGVIYIGLNVNQTLCAFSKTGQKLWERVLGQGLGSYPITIANDGTIYACVSSTLFALDPDGSTKWRYMPKEGNVVTTPAIDKEGNLYLNLSAFRLISLSRNGEERWASKVKGAALVPPVIGCCNKLYQQSFMQDYPQYKSWIEAYSKEGEKIWTYELNGNIISTVLADDNLIYAVSNCHTYSKKGWEYKADVKWELHAIGKN